MRAPRFALALLSVALGLAVLPLTAIAGEKIPVGMWGFDAVEGKWKDRGVQLNDLVAQKLSAIQDFTLVDRAAVSKALTEQERTSAGLGDKDYAIRVGRQAGARVFVVGEFMMREKEKRVMAVVKIVSMDTGRMFGIWESFELKAKPEAVADKIIERINSLVESQRAELFKL